LSSSWAFDKVQLLRSKVPGQMFAGKEAFTTLKYKIFWTKFQFLNQFSISEPIFNFWHNVAVLCRQQTCPGTFDLQSGTLVLRSKWVQNLISTHSTTRDFTLHNILNQISITEPIFNFWHNVAVLRRQQTCPGTFDLQSGTLSKAQLELKTYIHSTFMPSFTAVIWNMLQKLE
jgi:hypothetical protein